MHFSRTSNITDIKLKARSAGLTFILQHIPVTAIFAFSISIGIYLISENKDNRYLLLAWLYSVLFLGILWSSSAVLDLKNDSCAKKSTYYKNAVMTGLSASVFGAVSLLIYYVNNGKERVLLTALLVGIFFCGVFVFSPIRLYSIIWVITVGMFSFFATLFLYPWPNNIYSVLVFAFIILAAIIASRRSKQYTESFINQINLEEKNRIIDLLLRNFDEQTGDWLWQIDQNGLITTVSEKMSKSFCLTQDELIGKDLVQILEQSFVNPDPSDIKMLKGLKARLAKSEPFQDYPVRFVSNRTSRWWALTAMPYEINEVRSGWLGVGRDISEQKAYEEEIERQANFDSLTGLANRYYLRQLLSRYLQTMEPGTEGALAFLHIRNLRMLNTSLGHETADLLLVEIGNRMRSFHEEGKILTARLGGGDFSILLLDTPRGDQLANRIVVELCKPILINQELVEVEVSTGIAFFPKDAEDVDSLFRCVDLALASAKETDEPDIIHFDTDMADRSLNQLNLINEMNRGLENGEFELRYQPVVNLDAQVVTGVEALIRWNHPVRGIIPPMEFIPLAERSGKILNIGRWVLEKACEDAASWPIPWSLSVNVAARQFQSKNFVEIVRTALYLSGLSAERLKLEITESTIIEDNTAVKETMLELRSMGVSIVLDDFGTGYSSLTYLRNFPLNELKIDQSFVRSIGKDSESAAIINTIILLAGTLSLQTTAEGVETLEQADFLKSHNCTLGQGYYFGQPMDNHQLTALYETVMAE